MRRIEAVAGLNAYESAVSDAQRLQALAVKIGTPLPELEKRVEGLIAQQKELEKALGALNVPCEARYYPGGIHAFHALVWDPAARRCWRDALAFLDRHMRPI